MNIEIKIRIAMLIVGIILVAISTGERCSR